jgi:hypothetical protein
MRQNLIIITTLLLLTSCARHKSANEIQWTRSDSDIFYISTQDKVKQLGLDSLQNGSDSLQIRIWYDYSIVRTRKLFVIKRTNSIWTASLYTMSVTDKTEKDLQELNSPEKIKLEKTENLQPKIGWDKFINKLLSLQIISLPDMYSISGMKVGMEDGMTYCIEVAMKHKYRFYSYSNPNEIKEKYWQAKNMSDIINLLNSELEVLKENKPD